MEVTSGPAHRDLYHLMKIVERQVARQIEATPDRRLGPEQIQANLVAGTVGTLTVKLRGGTRHEPIKACRFRE